MDNEKVCISTCTKDWGLKNKLGIRSINDYELELDINLDKHIYMVYKEDISKFDIPPIESNINLDPDKEYEIEYRADIDGDVKGVLYFIGYSDNEKIQTESFNVNKKKTLKVDKNCKYCRLAIRFTGNGKFKLDSINIKPKKNIDYKDIIKVVSCEHKDIKSTKELRVACIVDYFTQVNLEKEVNLIQITPDNWLDILENNSVDILFVESAWQGNEGSWKYKVGKYYNGVSDEIKELIRYCNAKNIPTIFWNKEDPFHFEKFIDTAKLFDYIFTTDRDMIKKYKEITNNENVYVMPFAVQPKLHNPIVEYEKINGICFAGSYYGNRHEDRRKDMEEILDLCKNYTLYIYDRNYEQNTKNPNSQMKFPERFNENIVGNLDYKYINKAYKGYKLTLNVNSIKNSPTMFSRRVFESLACGTPVISTYSKGIKMMFDDIVICEEDKGEIETKIKKLYEDKLYLKQISLKGIREVMLKHTYEDRIIDMMNKIGINIDKNIPKISCINFINNIKEIDECIELFNNQSYTNKELIIIIESKFNGYIDILNNYNTDNIKCFIGDYVTKKYNNIYEIVNGEYVTYMNPKCRYGNNYLLDMYIASIYTQSKIIGKSSFYSVYNNKIKIENEENEYIFVNSIKSDRCIIKTDILNNINIRVLLNTLKYSGYILKNKTIEEYIDNKSGIIGKFRGILSNTFRNNKKDYIQFDLVLNNNIFSIDNMNFIEINKNNKDIYLNNIFI